ncbi:hypothetical protein PILCRDRAFT_239071 [Piloderma croceum F 1598]|uniref:Major facilitator superfamily (MFS) profile domain-containing protein n=1 Tax=Piloderma croceum (strain F 1598) TaxID=765440 RepID=A0A0C3CGB6_PILCF|nr:hypothetical protein PILCRDRAFT_239071 [Piloderma croceum F 1598]
MINGSVFRRRPTAVDSQLQTTPDPELKLPKTSSLVIIIISNLLLQVSFFIIVSSSNAYIEHLGGTSVLSGVTLGIPTVFAGLVLLPMMKYDRGMYMLSIHVSCAGAILGHILYALAYPTKYLYLILIGRIVNGFAFSGFMYNKKYCSDARMVGIRRRTTLGSWIVITQGLGMSLGPFAGGLLYKVGFKNQIFNGYTSPGWIMAAIWAVFWVCAMKWYEDPQVEPEETFELQTPNSMPLPPKLGSSGHDIDITVTSSPQTEAALPSPKVAHVMSLPQWGVVICMCWFAMSCWFILGAWEANLPIFGASVPTFHWSPFAAGNFIALGGICAFPFLLANLFIARRIEDRHLLAFGTALGLAGLVILVSLLQTHNVSYGSLFVSWWSVALGFNLASTVTVSLLSKQLPARWNGRSSLAIQYSNYLGRVTGAVWGGSGVKVGMTGYAGFEMGLVGVGTVLFCLLWRDLKAKRG